jgi:tetratricopeptide (TPR) repeat protein
MKAESMIAEAKASKVDLPKEIEDLDRAKSKFEEGDFEASEKLLDEVMDRTEKKLAMYLAAKIILTAKESIELAEAHDIDLAEGQQLLVKTKELMKKKDYEEALETAKRCEELVSSTMQNAVGEQITDLRRLITDAKNVGIDTSGPEILAEKAASLVEEADYPEVLRCIDAARNDIDQIKNLSSQAAIEIKSARTRLKDAEALDMEVGKASEFLDQAIEALTRHQYAIALELSRKSSDASSEITKTTIWDTLQKFKDRVDRAASDGTTVGVAERCVSEGVEAFNEGRYQDALRLAMKCEAEIDRVELQREISTKAVEMATKKLNDAMNEGIVVDAVRESVQEATQLLSQGKYVDALSKALESGDRLHQVRERLDSTRIEMSSVKEQVERLKKVGIDTTGCDELLSVAQQQLSKHQFSQSKETLSKCSQTAMEVFERSINDVMEQNKELISRAKMMGLNTKPCEDLMHVAQTSFSEKLWDFAYQQAQACRTTGIDIISKKIDKLALESTERLGPLKALGASVSVVEELIEQARGAVANGDASEAFQILMEADQRILGIEDSHKKYADISIAAESAIETLKRIGVSTSESERLLALADLEREKDYDSAIEFVAEALDSAKTAIDSYAPEITGSVSSSDLQEGSEGEIEIALKNTGNVVGRDLSIELSGQFKVLEVPSIASLRPGAELKIKAKIVPEKSGDLSIRVSTECKRQFDGAPQSFVFEDILSVFRSGPPFKLTRATEVAKCANCQGKIKQGFDIVSCRCGSQLHLACAKRTAKCPVCGQTYTF